MMNYTPMTFHNPMRLIFIWIFLLASYSIFAQKPHAKIKALKTAYITDHLDLSDTESEKFWPYYYAHHKKMRQYRKNSFIGKTRTTSIAELKDLSDAQAKQKIAKLQQIEDKIHQEKKQYLLGLQSILPAKKIVLLLQIERQFKKQLLQKLRAKARKPNRQRH